MAIDWIFSFHTAVLISCLCIAACFLRACLSVCLCLSWSHTCWTKNNRIYKRERWGVFTEISQFLDPHTSTSNILNIQGKTTGHFVKKIGEKNKNKNNRCSKVLRISTQKQKFTQAFLKTSVFLILRPVIMLMVWLIVIIMVILIFLTMIMYYFGITMMVLIMIVEMRLIIPVDTGRKLNVSKTLNLRPVSTGAVMPVMIRNLWMLFMIIVMRWPSWIGFS